MQVTAERVCLIGINSVHVVISDLDERPGGHV